MTRLADVIVPEDYREYMAVDSPEVTRFLESGIAVRNPVLDRAANSGGNLVQLPFWRDLDATAEPNISNDDPEDLSTPQKVQAGKQIAIVSYLNQSWTAMDLVSELAGSDPVARIQARTNTYWGRQWQRRLIAGCVGIAADNVANDGSDMVVDIANDSDDPVSDDELFGGDAYIDAELTLGDQIGAIGAVAVHSQVYGRMRKQGLIDFLPDDEGKPTIAMYMGKTVIVDDGLPAVAGDNRITYTSILFGSGAIGWGMGNARVPVEVEREARAGNGSGQETLHERYTWLLHPAGYAADIQESSDQSPTLAELRAAAMWDRVVERKNIPMAFLRTNG